MTFRAIGCDVARDAQHVAIRTQRCNIRVGSICKPALRRSRPIIKLNYQFSAQDQPDMRDVLGYAVAGLIWLMDRNFAGVVHAMVGRSYYCVGDCVNYKLASP